MHESSDSHETARLPPAHSLPVCSILWNLPYATCVSRLENPRQIVVVNQSLTSLLGYTRKDLPDLQTFFKTVLKDETERYHFASWVGGVGPAASSPPPEEEFEMWTKTGHSVVIAVNASTADGLLVLAFRDVTLRKQAEQLNRLLLDTASDVVIQFDADDSICWITPSVSSVLGWTPEELFGEQVSRYIHPGDLDGWNILQHNARQGIAGEMQVRLQHRSGSYRYISASLRPHFDRHMQVVGMVGGWHDIHDEALARQVAETERARLRATLDSMLDAHMTLRPVRNAGGEITDFIIDDVNHTICEERGRTREQLIGERLSAICPNAHRTNLIGMYAATVQGGPPVVLNDFTDPHEVRGEDRRYDIRAVKVGDGLSVTFRDVTGRYRNALALAGSEEHYRMLLTNTYNTVLTLSDEGHITWISPSLQSMLGYEPKDWIGCDPLEFMPQEEGERVQLNKGRATAGESVVARYRVYHKDGSLRWAETFAKPYINNRGERCGIIVSFHLIDAQVAAETELEQRARTDELTKLLNRREVLQRMHGLVAPPAGEGPASHVAVLFCDLDQFKLINDTHGHTVGDEVLTAAADRLKGCLRGGYDMGARFGGDELLVVLHDIQNADDAVAVANKLCRAIAKPIPTSVGPLTITMSVGVTMAQSGETIEELLARADTAMYRAKQGGRNTVTVIRSDAPGEKAA